jgi:hypothetical protein
VIDSYFMMVTGAAVFGPAGQVTASSAGHRRVRGGYAASLGGRPAQAGRRQHSRSPLRQGDDGCPGYAMSRETRLGTGFQLVNPKPSHDGTARIPGADSRRMDGRIQPGIAYDDPLEIAGPWARIFPAGPRLIRARLAPSVSGAGDRAAREAGAGPRTRSADSAAFTAL